MSLVEIGNEMLEIDHGFFYQVFVFECFYRHLPYRQRISLFVRLQTSLQGLECIKSSIDKHWA